MPWVANSATWPILHSAIAACLAAAGCVSLGRQDQNRPWHRSHRKLGMVGVKLWCLAVRADDASCGEMLLTPIT
jgi:hypothetical protein